VWFTIGPGASPMFYRGRVCIFRFKGYPWTSRPVVVIEHSKLLGFGVVMNGSDAVSVYLVRIIAHERQLPRWFFPLHFRLPMIYFALNPVPVPITSVGVLLGKSYGPEYYNSQFFGER